MVDAWWMQQRGQGSCMDLMALWGTGQGDWALPGAGGAPLGLLLPF